MSDLVTPVNFADGLNLPPAAVIADDGSELLVGTDDRNTTSPGLQPVNLLAEQLEGNLELPPGPGTAFRVGFGNLYVRCDRPWMP